ncbi:hypothetical protein N0V95_003258 [Ascochyta clinopodiicola]|nr:hypothetical protein N0V95_003258 [Ascochyta clinopodiicola]
MVLAAKQRVSTSQRSPTLSDAGMILPGFEANHARSTSPVFERPPSVSALYDAYQSPKLDFPPQSRRRASRQQLSPPLSAQSSHSTLRDKGNPGASAKRMPSRDNMLASSPPMDANGPRSYPAGSWEEQEQRRLSTASSMLSEDFENWPGFDSHDHFDDSGVDLQEQDNRGRTPRGLAKDGDDMENDRWMNGRTSGSDEDDMDDPQSSAALSRRAEMILANAKKRLNVMEGNLRGARESLVVSPTFGSGKDSYQAGTSPVTQNAGLGIKTDSPTRKALYEDGGSPTTTFSQREGEMLVVTRERSPKGLGIQQAGVNPPSTIDEVTETSESAHGYEEAEDDDFVSVDGKHMEPGGDSVYEDAVYEMPVTERHEDRVDAFDYEHFFLHSAMGTYSLEHRRSSISSNSSTATTRPVTAMQSSEELSNAERRISMHQRNPSVDSVSTVATFATAASHQSDDDDDENEQMDQFSQQILSHNQHIAAQRPSLVSLRSDSAINMRRGPGLSPPQTALSRGSSRTSSSSGSLASGLQTSKIYAILTESQRDEPRLALSEEEKQLIYSLAAGFQSVCANLQNTYGEQDDRKAWRRRLDHARKILAGEEVEDDQAF